jgi:zinc transport system ATP-binding protein
MSTDSSQALLSCEQLVVGYKGEGLLPPIDLTIRRGHLLAVLGRNGSGKSTFSKTLLGFVPEISGRIVHPDPPPRMAFMAQAATIDPLVPVRAREVVAAGTLSGWSFLRRQAGVAAAVDAALGAVDATALGDSFVRDLSEGQRQRVLLARILAARADVVFLDEPTAAMDAVAEQRALALLKQWSRSNGTAVILITHMLGLARRHADEVLYLDRDDGIALCAPPATVFEHPTFRRQFGEVDEND